MNTTYFTIDKNFRCHGGTLRYLSHESETTKTTMRFTLFTPPPSQNDTSTLLVFLSGLTCTEDNFTTKANAYLKASELGMSILAPDTSPRGTQVPDDNSYDLGQGASFYLDATQAPWAEHFQMETYLIKELLPRVEAYFAIGGQGKRAITGHSMGGLGALNLHLRHPGYFNSCSAFAPIVAPSQTPWGIKAFTQYLSEDQDAWQSHDPCQLVASLDRSKHHPILIDQGLADSFLAKELTPHLFEQACEESGQRLSLRHQDGYDHSYFFIQSFINDHLDWHQTLFAIQ